MCVLFGPYQQLTNTKQRVNIMMVVHYRSKEEAQKNCNNGETVVMEGNAVVRYRVAPNSEMKIPLPRRASPSKLKNDCTFRII